MSSSDACVRLAVNGTLMRGLELNPNLLAVGGSFIEETTTASCYRLWSIHDRHPGMLRVVQGGAAIELEVWSIPRPGLAAVLLGEPAGLCVGKVQLGDQSEVLGVLAEPWLCEGCAEITPFGGWRRYITSKSRG